MQKWRKTILLCKLYMFLNLIEPKANKLNIKFSWYFRSSNHRVSHIPHLKSFDFIVLKRLHKRGQTDRQTEKQTSRQLDQSGPRADSVKITI